MGLKGFRAHISIKQKSSKTSAAPEFYRKLPHFDSDFSQMQNNGTRNYVQTCTGASVGDIGPHFKEEIVQNNHSRVERAEQSVSKTKNDIKQGQNASNINIKPTELLITEHLREAESSKSNSDMGIKKQNTSKSDVSDKHEHIEAIVTMSKGKFAGIEMEI